LPDHLLLRLLRFGISWPPLKGHDGIFSKERFAIPPGVSVNFLPVEPCRFAVSDGEGFGYRFEPPKSQPPHPLVCLEREASAIATAPTYTAPHLQVSLSDQSLTVDSATIFETDPLFT